MPGFSSYDDTALSYRLRGHGEPLVCLPGGPGRSADSLGDLGGLSDHRSLVLLDQRGTGASAVPADPETMRADRLVEDVEALRLHLALDRLDLLAHSAAGNVAILYAAAHPDRVRRLVLVTPASQALGVETTVEEFLAAARKRAGETRYARAYAAAQALVSGDASDQTTAAFAPLNYGRFDAAAEAHAASTARQTAGIAASHFFPPDGFAVEAVRASIGRLAAPVLVYGGAIDVMPIPDRLAQLALLFPRSIVAIQPEAGHHPWLDDAAFFAGTVAQFLARD
jgi:pimeloyl-ACP methyl ester carboxylesterase